MGPIVRTIGHEINRDPQLGRGQLRIVVPAEQIRPVLKKEIKAQP
jgi:hypothetical protein